MEKRRDGQTAERQLMRRIARGDERAFDQLYRDYHQLVFNYILRLINEPATAEELLQEVYLAVWRGAGRFRAEATIKTWMMRIAHHQAVSWLRRNHQIVPLDETNELADDGDELDDSIMAQWTTEQIRLALAQLTPTHRAVIELVFVQQLPYADIALVMDCPLGTVKSRVSYAMRYLTAILRDMDKG